MSSETSEVSSALSLPFYMTGLSIALATQVVPASTPRVSVAVTVAHALVHASIVVNVVAFALTELCTASGRRGFVKIMRNAFVCGGALLPAAAVSALFVGTQPLEAIIAAAVTLVLGFAGCVAVCWF